MLNWGVVVERVPLPNPFLAPRKARPIVVGHRGVPALHQENTLAGFRRAIELGIPAVELDVRLTADGRAVCVHDANLERLTGMQAEVADLTWDEVSKLRIRRELPMGIALDGSNVTSRYDRAEPIPLLEEVLSEIGGKLLVNIELKVDLPRWWPTEVGAVVAREIARAHVDDRVIVTSFDPRKLLAALRHRPRLAIGFCFDDTMLAWVAPLLARLPPLPVELCPLDRRPGHHARRVLSRIVDTGFVGRLLDNSRIIGAEHTLIGRNTVERLHDQGIAIGTHTIFPVGSTGSKPLSPTASTEAEVERLVDLRVDWIESDDPERLLDLIG